MNQRVLVDLHHRAGLANVAAQLLHLLHGKAAVIHDPHGGNAVEILLDAGEHLLVLSVGHVVRTPPSQSFPGSAPVLGGPQALR